MDDQPALKEVAKMWGTVSPLAPMSEDELIKVPEDKGAVRTAYGQENLGAEAGPSTGASPAAANDGQDHRSARGSPAAIEGGSQLDPVHGCRRARNHTATDADNGGVEKIPHTGDLPMRSETSAHGNPAHGGGGKITKAGADTPAQQRLSKVKLLNTEPLAWHYMRWKQEKQCHEPAEAATPSRSRRC